MIRPLLLIAACASLAACSDRAKPSLGLRNDAAKAAVMLHGVQNVRLTGPVFKCVWRGPPEIYQGGWYTSRAGYFFTAERQGTAVRGAVCAARNSGNAAPANVAFF